MQLRFVLEEQFERVGLGTTARQLATNSRGGRFPCAVVYRVLTEGLLTGVDVTKQYQAARPVSRAVVNLPPDVTVGRTIPECRGCGAPASGSNCTAG